MFFNQDEDDQDFLSPSGGSKLASLFGMDSANNQGGNESLTYTAPKEPKKKKPGAAESKKEASGTTILHAVAAHCYKYVDNNYASQGKLGVAVLGNHDELDYKILLYISKQQQVTHANITTAFSLTILPNNYISFYDHARQGWSVMFDSQDVLLTFAKQVALAKANSAGSSLNTLVWQDLCIGEGGSLEGGDHVELKYTGWLLQNHGFGQEFDSNTSAEKLFRFKVGKGKVIKGWDEGVLGMKKYSRRLLIIPPSLGYGQSGKPPKIPGGAVLIFDLEVVRVKLAKGAGDSAEPSPAVTPAVTPAATPVPVQEAVREDVEFEGETVKARSKSISDQLAHGNVDSSGSESAKSEKAKLISRMARMGQPMIPVKGAVSAELSDSDEDDSAAEHGAPKPNLPPKPVASAGMVHAHNTPIVQPTAQAIAQPVAQNIAQPMGPTADHSAFTQPVMSAQPVMAGPQMAPHTSDVHPSVFQGVQMPSQMAVYQPPIQPYQVLNQPNQYGYPQQNYQDNNSQNQRPWPDQAAQVAPMAPQPMAPPPQPAPASDVHTPMLLSEARQQNTEIRLSLSKMQDKMDKLYDKVETISSSGSQGMALNLHGSIPNMEANILLHSIQKLVQDNERLKKELFEKNARIESQNEKISDLLQRNQKYVEQSHNMLEQRNDTFKTTAAQSQTRLLQLEQERVQIVTELASERSQVGTLQLELANAKKMEMELRQQLESTITSGQSHRSDISTLRTERNELEQRLEQATASLKEERSTRKQLESQVGSLQEDGADLKSSCESLEKNLSERKRKFSQEKKKFEEELEELKSQHEEEISSLKEKLRRQKTSFDASTSEQVIEIEKDLNKEWKDKCDRLLSSAQDKHERAIADLQEEKGQLEEKLIEMEKKVSGAAAAAKGEVNKQVETLKAEVDSLKAWKDKYEHLRGQAASMKDKYEGRIAELEEEKKKIIADGKKAVEKAQQSVAGAGAGGSLSKDDLVSEVKKIMNSVYHELKGEFSADKTYKGSEIHGVILDTVKSTTMKVVQDNEEEEISDEEEEEEEEDAVEEKEAVVKKDKEAVRVKSEEQVVTQEVQSVKPLGSAQVPARESESSTLIHEHTDKEKTVTDSKPPPKEPAKEQVHKPEEPLTASRDEIQNKDKSHVEKEDMAKKEAIVEEAEVQTSSEKKGTSSDADDIETGKSGPEVNLIKDMKTDDVGKKVVSKEQEALVEKEISARVEDIDLGHTQVGTSETEPDKDLQEPEKESESGSFAPVVEKMEVASVGAPLTAPLPSKPAEKKEDKNKKKDDKDEKKKEEKKPSSGGFSLGALEASIVTVGQPLPKTDKNKSEKASPPGASDPKKPKTETETVPVVAHVTGARGNPYYAEELRKAAEEAKKVQAQEEKHVHKSKDDKSKDKSKDKHSPVSPVIAPITGDKGNPYYAEELRKAAEKAKEAQKVEAAPEVAQVSMTTSSAPPPAAKGKEQHVHAPVCGDKGNPHYAEELRKAAEAAKAAHPSPQEAPVHAYVTGDKGNPYYAAELVGKKLEHKVPEPKKRSPEDVLAGIESSIMTFGDITPKEDSQSKKDKDKDKLEHKVPEPKKRSPEDVLAGIESSIMSFGVVTPKEDSQSKKDKDKDNKSQQQKKDDKAAAKEKVPEKKDTKTDAKAQAADPLFGDSAKSSKPADKKKSSDKKLVSDDKPLFDDDSDDEKDMFGSKAGKKDAKKPADKKPAEKKPEPKKEEAAKGAKKGSSDSEDDSPLKPPPPPLFDDEDDDDANWMS